MTVTEVGMIEGSGDLECTSESHSEPFKTRNLVEFNKHLEEEGHILKGAAPCVLCKAEVNLDKNPIPVGKSPICDECKSDLIKELKKSESGPQ